MTNDVKLDCPICKGKGILISVIYVGGLEWVERKEPCFHCTNSGKVTAEEYMKITGRK